MARSKSGKGARVIHPTDVHKASPDYKGVVSPYYRAEAALTIESAFKRWTKVKKARKEAQDFNTDNEPKLAKESRARYWAARGERIRTMKKLEEPVDIDAEFNRVLLDAIKANQYHRIDFKHKDFTPCLFAALRLGLITMNQMMTTKLMYESLLSFNNGKMPENPSAIFHRFKLSDASSPYQPSKEITHWGKTESDKLHDKLESSDAEKHHYYTIDLPRHQAIGFLYYGITEELKSPQFITILSTYIDRLNLTDEGKNALKADLAKYQANPGNEHNKQYLKALIELQEADLKSFLKVEYDATYTIQNINLTSDEFNREYMSTQFMVNLYAVDCQIPMFNIAPIDSSLKSIEQPLLSFVLPTIDTLNMLQNIAHGDEATVPVAVIGQETPRMIRAYDEIPAQKASGKAQTVVQTLLSTVYPTVKDLSVPSRPIELTYPGVVKTAKPHGADCHDFLLGWHDVFHAWRNGSNYKDLIRHFRQLHDQKSGFAAKPNGMSKTLWTLTDIDFSAGTVFRESNTIPAIAISAFENILTRAGYNFDKVEDDNYLFIYDLCQSPDDWGKPFGIDPTKIDQINSDEVFKRDGNIKSFHKKVKETQAYLSNYPEASVVELILADLLTSSNISLLNLINRSVLNFFDEKQYKDIFYWAQNTGLYFRDEYRDALGKLGVKPKLRDNSPYLVFVALKYMVIKKYGPDSLHIKPLIKLEMDNYIWPNPIVVLMSVILWKKYNSDFLSKTFVMDEKTCSVALKKDGQLLSTMEPKAVAELYFDQLNDEDLNFLLKIKKAYLDNSAPFLTDKTINRLDDSLFVRLIELKERGTGMRLGDGRDGNPKGEKHVTIHSILKFFYIDKSIMQQLCILMKQ